MNGWTVGSLLLCVIVFLPIATVITNLLGGSEHWSHISQYLLPKYILSTMYLTFGVGIVSTIIGVGCAYMVTCYDFYGRRFVEWVLVLPMTIPTYIAAYSYYDALELLTPLMLWSRRTLGTDWTIAIENLIVYLIVMILFSFVLYPYIYITTRASLILQGSRLIEAASMLGISSRRVLDKVILPLIRPAVIAGLSLVIMETLNDYAAVEYFGIPTLTIGIFRSWFGMNDMASALKLSAYMIIFVFAVLGLEKYIRGKQKYHNTTGTDFRMKRSKMTDWKGALLLILCLVPFVFGFLIPVLRLLTWAIFSETSSSDIDLYAITLNTVGISLFSCLLVVSAAFFVNFIKNYYNNDIVQKFGKVAILGYSMPGAIVAIGVLKFNGYMNDSFSLLVTGSITGLVFAYLTRFLAVAWQPIESSMEKQCGSINQSARVLNAPLYLSLTKVNIPILRKPILFACLIVFIDIVKELPLTLILRPFNFDTLSTLTYDMVSQAQFFQSSVPSLMIILVSMPAIFLINKQMNKD